MINYLTCNSLPSSMKFKKSCVIWLLFITISQFPLFSPSRRVCSAPFLLIFSLTKEPSLGLELVLIRLQQEWSTKINNLSTSRNGRKHGCSIQRCIFFLFAHTVVPLLYNFSALWPLDSFFSRSHEVFDRWQIVR